MSQFKSNSIWSEVPDHEKDLDPPVSPLSLTTTNIEEHNLRYRRCAGPVPPSRASTQSVASDESRADPSLVAVLSRLDLQDAALDEILARLSLLHREFSRPLPSPIISSTTQPEFSATLPPGLLW
ncbi:hypothetical protein [Bromus-associated circular DNA virus 2]|uniref:hypothetical protein n=1 Tax=Bromus-associated circular DNA virus 2 TaxID=1590155 RepID=UPI000585E351|nr:hypothetical protein [Bromus-associated circular DNA virus 2]AJC52526.1 hypothetical protein [Bromus-associated circular DNA virus 2]